MRNYVSTSDENGPAMAGPAGPVPVPMQTCTLNTQNLEKTQTLLTYHCYILPDTLCEVLLTLPSFSGDLALVLSWEPPHHCQSVHIGG